MSSPILAVNQVSWHIGDKSILDNVSFTVKPKQFVGIIGCNGSGKTSLLRTLYRYTKPSNGSVSLNNSDIWQSSANSIAQQIAVVTQAPSSLPYRVSDVVAMGLTPHKRLFEGETVSDKQKISAALAQVDLSHLAQSQFDTLSGGEQQRALIARAIVQDSSVLIMDEPTNHLDVHYQIDVLQRVKALNTTVIASLHDLNLASAYCDQLILLDNGEVVAQGTPEQVLNQALISRIYRVNVSVAPHPDGGHPHLTFHYGAPSCHE